MLTQCEFTEEECYMCRETFFRSYYHVPADCPLEQMLTVNGPVRYFECSLCIGGRDCQLHGCPLCLGTHVRSECTCPPETIAYLVHRFMDRMVRDQNATHAGEFWHVPYWQQAEEEQDAEYAAAGGLVGALRALGAEED
jgi:hypothetical protein